MDIRQGALLSMLIETTHFTPLSTFTETLQCSDKTIRNDLKSLNALLASNGYFSKIATKRGSGVRMVLGSGEKARLENLLSENAIAMRPRLDRFYQGVLLVACSQESFTMATLAQRLYTNKQQLQLDMHHWDIMLAPFGLSLNKKRRISFEGSEVSIRFFILYFFFSLASVAMKNKIEPLFMEGYEDFFANVINSIEEELHFKLSGNARHQLSTYMKLMIERVKVGCGIVNREKELNPAFSRAKANIEQRFAIKLNDNEMGLLADLFLCATWQWNTELVHAHVPSAQSATMSTRIAAELEQRFGIAPDIDLAQPLAILVETALVRRQRNFSIETPNERSIKYDYMHYFMLMTGMFYDTPPLCNPLFFGTDYVRICMLLLEYFDTVHQLQHYRCGLVVNCGIEQTVFGRYRIEKNVPSVKIEDILTNEEVLADAEDVRKRCLAERFDMLIAFDPLESALPIVTISERIDQRDILKILQLTASLEGAHQTDYIGELDDTRIGLKASSLDELLSSMYADLTNEGVLNCSEPKFLEVFSANSLFTGSTIVFTLYGDSVQKTISRSYEIATGFYVYGHRLTTVATLLIKTKDRPWLASMTNQFKLRLEKTENLSDAQSEFYVS